MTRNSDLVTAVEDSLKAPSVHNTQPWRWRFGRNDAELHADRGRQLTGTDPEGRDLMLDGTHPVSFAKADVVFAPRTRLPGHPNAMTLKAFGADGAVIVEDTYYSIGGGFIRRDGEPPRLDAQS